MPTFIKTLTFARKKMQTSHSTKNSKIKKGNQAYKNKNYNLALEIYREVIKERPYFENILYANMKLCNKKIDNTPKISVIVPTHNVEKYITHCISSITNQTLKNIEIIIVDDGSKDKTTEIIKKYPKADKRIKVIYNHTPSGNSGTPRNQALCIAKGDYIAFVDADDYIERTALESLYSEAILSGSDIVSAGGFYREHFDGTTETIKVDNRHYDPITQPNREELLNSIHFPIVWFRIYKNEFIVKNKIVFGDFKTSADTPFSFIALAKANKVSVIDGIYYHYRFDRPGSTIDRRKGIDAFEVFRSYNMIINRLKKEKTYSKLIPYVIKKAVGDWTYNNKFLKDSLKPEFEKLIGSLISQHYDSINDWSSFSEYWKNVVEKINKKYKNSGKNYLQEYLKSMRDKKKKVSVVIPAHNVEKYITKCLESLLSQTLKELEIIVVNDGSTDKTSFELKKLIKKNNSINLITLDTPTGNAGIPRNVGMAYLQGEYTGFVDADDWVSSNHYQLLHDATDGGLADIVTGSGFHRAEGKNIKTFKFNPKSYDAAYSTDKKELFDQPFFSNLWPRIYRTDFIREEGINIPSIYLSEDFCFSFVCYCLAKKINTTDNKTYYYRYDRPGSTTNNRKGEQAFLQIKHYNSILRYIEKYSIEESLVRIFFHKKINSFHYTYLKLSKPYQPEFKSQVKKIIETNPYIEKNTEALSAKENHQIAFFLS